MDARHLAPLTQVTRPEIVNIYTAYTALIPNHIKSIANISKSISRAACWWHFSPTVRDLWKINRKIIQIATHQERRGASDSGRAHRIN